MNRSLKKFIYGSFYGLVVVLLVVLSLDISFERKASCFDDRQNQNETGIDCGGACTPCAIKNLEPLRISAPLLLSLGSGRTVLLADIVNPNRDFGASRFEYAIKIFGNDGRLLQTISREESIYSSERRYIYNADIEVTREKIGEVRIIIGSMEWRPTSEIIRPSLSLRGDPATEIGTSAIRVRGTLVNQSSLGARNVRIIAVLRSDSEEHLFASQTIIDSLLALSEASFTITFPADKNIFERIFPGNTQIFISSQ